MCMGFFVVKYVPWESLVFVESALSEVKLAGTLDFMVFFLRERSNDKTTT